LEVELEPRCLSLSSLLDETSKQSKQHRSTIIFEERPNLSLVSTENTGEIRQKLATENNSLETDDEKTMDQKKKHRRREKREKKQKKEKKHKSKHKKGGKKGKSIHNLDKEEFKVNGDPVDIDRILQSQQHAQCEFDQHLEPKELIHEGESNQYLLGNIEQQALPFEMVPNTPIIVENKCKAGREQEDVNRNISSGRDAMLAKEEARLIRSMAKKDPTLSKSSLKHSSNLSMHTPHNSPSNNRRVTIPKELPSTTPPLSSPSHFIAQEIVCIFTIIFFALSNKHKMKPIFSYVELSQPADRRPPGVIHEALELHLSEEEFYRIFGKDRDAFAQLPIWKKVLFKYLKSFYRCDY